MYDSVIPRLLITRPTNRLLLEYLYILTLDSKPIYLPICTLYAASKYQVRSAKWDKWVSYRLVGIGKGAVTLVVFNFRFWPPCLVA